MEQKPTDEEMGRVVLKKSFGELGKHPGEILKYSTIISKLDHYGYRWDDVNRGLQWLLDNGHIEEQRNGRSDTLFLTDNGYHLFQHAY